MGRYYNGDIEGKFWFAVQSSDAADRFGGDKYEPQFINYQFNKDEHYEGVCKEIKAIEKKLGVYKDKLDKFFQDNNGYNDDMLLKAGFPEDRIHMLLMDYADLELGNKIKKCLEDTGSCNFEAEC